MDFRRSNCLYLKPVCITSKDKDLDCNDFIGEVATRPNGTYLTGVLDYLKDKFPELK